MGVGSYMSFKLPIETDFNNNNMRNILLLSLYLFINLVNKKSLINMNENLRLNLVEVAVLECLKLAKCRVFVCVFQPYVCKCIRSVIFAWLDTQNLEPYESLEIRQM